MSHERFLYCNFLIKDPKRQVYIDPNGDVQLVTWRADKPASFVAFNVSVDFFEGDEFSEQII